MADLGGLNPGPHRANPPKDLTEPVFSHEGWLQDPSSSSGAMGGEGGYGGHASGLNPRPLGFNPQGEKSSALVFFFSGICL